MYVQGTRWQKWTTNRSRGPYFLCPEEQVGGSSAQQDGLFSVPLKPQFVCVQGTCMSMHSHACMPVCGFQDHMFTFSSLHICAGNNSSSPHRNDHSLSGLIRQLLNLNDVDVWDPSSVSLLYNGTQSPLPHTINSIFCSQKVQIYQPWIRSNKIVFPRVILQWWDHFLFIFSLIKCENMVILRFMFIVWLIQTSCRKQNP